MGLLSLPTRNDFVFALALLLLASECLSVSPVNSFPSSDYLDSNHAVILQYHHVSEDTPAATSISPGLFRQQMQYIKDEGFSVWPLERVIKHLGHSTHMPDKVIAITFDDAYKSVYENAWPVLEESGFPFTIFLSTDAVREENGPAFLSWPEINQMAEGGASFGNHTKSHTHLVRKLEGESPSQWKSRIRAEILQAEETISLRTGKHVNLLAYPYGEYNSAIKRLASKLGYTAFGQHSGAAGALSDFQALPRFPMTEDYGDLAQFHDKIYSLPMPVVNTIPEIHEISPGNARPEIEVFLKPGIVDISRVRCFASRQGAISVEKIKNGFRVKAGTDLPSGRSRYNCTAPAGQIPGNKKSGYSNSRFFWYSIPFYRKLEDGSWYEE